MAFGNKTQDVNNHVDGQIITKNKGKINLVQTGNINVKLETNSSGYKIQLVNGTGDKIPELQPVFVYQMFNIQFLIFGIILIFIYIKKILND